jgi:hypothetical protein
MTHSTYRARRNGASPAEISGLQIVQQRRSKKERARLAVSIYTDETKLQRLTLVQLSRLVGVSAQYVGRIRRENNTPPVVTQLAAE